MNHKQRRAAFSLIELSIVILIIGILVAGVTQSSRLIKAFRISSARTITASSPVYSIKDLAFWLDATSENNLLNQDGSNQVSDGDTISSWKDSSLKTTESFCTQGTIANQPEYVEDAMNGRPALRYDSNAGNMRLSCTLPQGTNIETTIFMVFNWTSSSFIASNTLVIGNGGLGTTLTEIGSGGNFQFRIWNGASNLDVLQSNLNVGENIIMTRSNNPTTNSSVLYKNGASVATSTASISGVYSDLTLTVGNYPNTSRTLGGDIGEIIIFDRALKLSEIQDVEDYLSRKWGIKLN
jgi:prepilin-type N-terminal cleavage/methylation domain-containing protein